MATLEDKLYIRIVKELRFNNMTQLPSERINELYFIIRGNGFDDWNPAFEAVKAYLNEQYNLNNPTPPIPLKEGEIKKL